MLLIDIAIRSIDAVRVSPVPGVPLQPNVHLVVPNALAQEEACPERTAPRLCIASGLAGTPGIASMPAVI